MGYIYRAFNTISRKSYVGLTTRTVEKRWKEHVKCAMKDTGCDYNTVLSKAIRKYPPYAWVLYIEYDGSDDVELLKLIERMYIQHFKTYVGDKDCEGYNSTRGGDTVCEFSNVPVSKVDILTGKIIKHYECIAHANRENHCRIENVSKFDIAFTNESREICFLLTNKIDNLSQEEIKEYIYDKCPLIIHQLDYDGHLLNSYVNSIQAGEKTNITIGNIVNTCSGKRRMAGGYQWCYQKDLKDRINKPLQELKLGKPIVQYGMDGKKIREWPNIETAAKFFGINGSHITGCCTGHRKTCQKYQWRFSSDNIDELEPLFQKRKIICVETGEIFETRNRAAKNFGVYMDTITSSINGKKTNLPYTFKYI